MRLIAPCYSGLRRLFRGFGVDMSQSSCAFAISGKNEMIGFLPHCLSLHSPSSMMFVSQREVCRIVGEQLSGNKTCPSHMSLLQERKEIAQSLLDGVSFLPTSFKMFSIENTVGLAPVED